MSQDPSDDNGYRPPPYHLTTWLLLGAAVLGLIGMISVRLKHQPSTSRDYPSRELIPDAEPVLLPPPEMSDEYWPCNDCHADEVPNPTRRELEEEHDQLKLAHGELWCLQCHDLEHRENLRLADGTLVKFEDSWQLCTQCHGEKLADWRAGSHGKRVGNWRGPKEYQPCVFCHNPHSPPFKPLEPKPPPVRPEQITLDAGAIGAPIHEQAH